MGWRHCRIAIAVGPEDDVASAYCHVIGAGATHDRLVVVVAHGVFIGEALQERDISLVHVVEGHRVAAAVVVDRRRGVKRIDLVRVVRDDERIEIAQAARRIAVGGILDIAIRLLPHLEEPMGGIAGVGIVRKLRALQREWSAR